MNNFISKELVDAGRYDQVLYLIDSIHASIDPRTKYPVDVRNSDRVAGSDIISGFTIVGNIIRIDETDDDVKKRIEELISMYGEECAAISVHAASLYAESYMDTYLHNYAVEISHRSSYHNVGMEMIRCWEILHTITFAILNLITDPDYKKNYLEILGNYCRIPDGWKAVMDKSGQMDFYQSLTDIISELNNLKRLSEETGVPIITASQRKEE